MLQGIEPMHLSPSSAVSSGPQAKPGRLRLLKFSIVAALVAGIVAAFILSPVSPRELLFRLLEWTRGMGALGPLYLALIYAAACVLFLPGSLLTLGAGFAFGLARGTLAACLGSLLGASASFLLGRTVARGAVERMARSRPRFRAIDEAVGKQGFKIVLLTRLSPVFPFNVLNYGLGITRVSFRDFFFASWIGMFPGTVMYVYFGTAVKSLADLAAGKVEGGPGGWVLLAVGLAATVLVTVVLTRTARRALAGAIAGKDGSGTMPPDGETKGSTRDKE